MNVVDRADEEIEAVVGGELADEVDGVGADVVGFEGEEEGCAGGVERGGGGVGAD